MRIRPRHAICTFAVVASIGAGEALAGRGGSLYEDETTSEYFWLTPGRTQVISGTCDRDCRDLDLRLFSPSGIEIDNDLLADDIPVVSVRPREAGRYRVEVIMAHCAIEPCGYELTLRRR